ncbi:hypothetical protein C8J57DRAFT_68126 [Mycena rebaudengoi]|nr:hypothetical protein C8J57DRAFT_1487273 [Mycena rebaudengoi]KAJ7242615.1 hypothetical protein C8J57DRAFT_68126 [Mycena rebaudengoi]
MHLLASIISSLVLAGTVLGSIQITVYEPGSCDGPHNNIVTVPSCGTCIAFDHTWGSVSVDSGFPSDFIWYAFTNSNCNPNRPGENLGFRWGSVQCHGTGPIGSIFLKCNGTPGL